METAPTSTSRSDGVPQPQNCRPSEAQLDQPTIGPEIARARDILEAFVRRNDGEEDAPSFSVVEAALAVAAANRDQKELARYWDGLLWSYDLEYSCHLEKYHRITSPAVLAVKLRRHRLLPDEVGFLVRAHAIVHHRIDAMTWAAFEYWLEAPGDGETKESRAAECLAGIPEVADILADFRGSRFGLAELNKRLLERTGQCLELAVRT